jgi:hypothetical protein
MLVTGRYAAIQRFHEQERQIRQQRLSSPQFNNPTPPITTNPSQPIMINNQMMSHPIPLMINNHAPIHTNNTMAQLVSNPQIMNNPITSMTSMPMINNMPQSSVNQQFQMQQSYQQYIMPETTQHPIIQPMVMSTAVVPPREEDKKETHVPEDLLISFD